MQPIIFIEEIFLLVVGIIAIVMGIIFMMKEDGKKRGVFTLVLGILFLVIVILRVVTRM